MYLQQALRGLADALAPEPVPAESAALVAGPRSSRRQEASRRRRGLRDTLARIVARLRGLKHQLQALAAKALRFAAAAAPSGLAAATLLASWA